MEIIQGFEPRESTEELKEGDVVRLRCGSPNMILIKINGRDKSKRAKCYWFDNITNSEREIDVPLMALETAENQLMRVKKFDAVMNNQRLMAYPAEAGEHVIMMGFESPEDRDNFLEQFAGEEKPGTKLN